MSIAPDKNNFQKALCFKMSIAPDKNNFRRLPIVVSQKLFLTPVMKTLSLAWATWTEQKEGMTYYMSCERTYKTKAYYHIIWEQTKVCCYMSCDEHVVSFGWTNLPGLTWLRTDSELKTQTSLVSYLHFPLSLCLSLCLSHTHTHLSLFFLLVSLSLSHSHTHISLSFFSSLSLSLSLSHTHTSRSRSLSLSLSLILSHTHTQLMFLMKDCSPAWSRIIMFLA